MTATSVTTSTSPFAALHAELLVNISPLRNAITNAYRRNETEAVQYLLSQVNSYPSLQNNVAELAQKLVSSVRQQRTRASGVDALMHEFSLSSEEGVALMCLAEALLRIPDHQTADRLIADKISKGDWAKTSQESPSMFVNAATWGLLVTGKLVATNSEQGLGAALTRLIAKGGEPLIRKRCGSRHAHARQSVRHWSNHRRSAEKQSGNEKRGYRYSYDMLGEAALTAKDAAYYYQSYETAIHAIGKASNGRGIKDGRVFQ
jgi:RHH-type proline utilization regulon transcriptional repressor/proline dehydrogenase/delta 1-pyrroline-5-carboxylate dehydrogenase